MEIWPQLFQPQGKYELDFTGEVLILSPGYIPTVDYYLMPRLRNIPASSVRFINDIAEGPDVVSITSGVFVIIVRHAPSNWLHFLVRYQSRLSGVAFLMDDDIPSAWRCQELPIDYRLWTTGRYWWVKHLLAKVCDRIWVSTPLLQARYAELDTRLLEPMEPEAPRLPAPVGTRRWGYHGTRTHEREIRWLLPIVEAVQAASPDYEFEIFGNARIARWFAHVPRVHVLAPRAWPEFLAHCRASNLAVGVAPLLPGRFNAVRSWVKMFDIARCGAVGIFSNRPPYAPSLEKAGATLLPNDAELWINEIVRLLQDDSLRLLRYENASAWIMRQESRDELLQLIQERPAEC